MRGPAVFVTAQLRDGTKLLEEVLPFFWRWSYYGFARVQLYQLAITVNGAWRRRGDISAAGTCQHLRRLHERAFRTFLRECLGCYAFQRNPFSTIVKLVVVNVGNESEPDVVVRMVEDQTLILAIGDAQSAADHLNKQHFRFGRPRQDDAAHIPVNAGRQAADITDNLHLAGMESPGDGVALRRTSVTIDVLGRDLGFQELGLQILGMSPIYCEA
jgi:hypothetical protein